MTRYPLMDNDEDLRAESGKRLDEITLEDAAALSPDDLKIRAETLRAQADIAQQAGYSQLAANLTRAAELTAVPNEELLQMYEVLRPGRGTHEQLTALAERLETVYNAVETANFVREAAAVYAARGLTRRT